jgi:hypothetical protein
MSVEESTDGPMIDVGLLQESYLAQSLLCGGMTAIRRLSFEDPGRAYEGFFGLANGIERTAKLILASHQYLTQDTFPTRSDFKKLGHDLSNLLARVDDVAEDLDAPRSESPSQHAGSKAVVEFLSKFAERDRYFHLNRLGQARASIPEDPLARWVRLVEEHAPASAAERTPRDAEQYALARSIDALPATVVEFRAPTGGRVSSVEQALDQHRQDEWTSIQGTLLAARPLRFLTHTITRVNQAKAPLPFYGEVFTEWLAPDSSLRRRRGFPRGRN